jgi:hypothetical protein
MISKEEIYLWNREDANDFKRRKGFKCVMK